MPAKDIHFVYKDLLIPSKTSIVLAVIDGLGGIPHPDFDNKTELEVANIPNLNTLAAESSCGAHIPVRSGITAGSVDAHIGVFGFDPLEVHIGRGAVEAAGVGFELGPDDIAARCNWATLAEGKIIDRRAQRKESAYYSPLIKRLQEGIHIEGVEIFIIQGAEHRFVTIFRKKGLGPDVTDTDPQMLNTQPLEPKGLNAESEQTAEIVSEFLSQAFNILKNETIANGFTMRAFSKKPHIASFKDAYGLHAAGIATHPLYKGIAKLFGMDVLPTEDKNAVNIYDSLKKAWGTYDFYYLHFKFPDSKGEDGDFKGKVEKLEEIDAIIPQIRALNPDVLAVTGDHSTPSYMAQHSWHPVPTMIWSKYAISDSVMAFNERACSPQGLNTVNIFAKDMIMPQILAQAGRFKKYGP